MRMKELAIQMAELAEKMQKFPTSSDDSWDTAVEEAATVAKEVFKDSCNHTLQGIDFMKSQMQYTYRPTLWVEIEFRAKFAELVSDLALGAEVGKLSSDSLHRLHCKADALFKRLSHKPETQEKDST